MGSHNYSIRAGARDASDDAWLGVRVAELCDDDRRVRGRDRFNLIE